MGGVKDKIISLFKINTTKNDSKLTCVSNVYGNRKKPSKPKIKVRSEHKIIWRIKDRTIRDIKNFF